MSRELLHSLPPCVLHEDEHLLVVNKPAGWNTHAPSPFAGEGIYDWLKHREPRWASLAIIHRLDKETSGVMVFGKTALANRSLTEQFASRAVRKKYVMLTDRPVRKKEFVVKTTLVRTGEKYLSRPLHAGGEAAETCFRLLDPAALSAPRSALITASPLTGRTHQIRVHAAQEGIPVLGDTLYGGTSFSRVCLHAGELSFQHPATGEEVKFCAPVDFEADTRLALRAALIPPEGTNAFRLIHGASDGWPGWHVDRLGNFLLSQSERALTPEQKNFLDRLLRGARAESGALRGAYHKTMMRQVGRTAAAEASPQLIVGEPAPERFTVRENGVEFELSFGEGYSVGLFLDQRDNRRRFLTGHVAANFPLWQSAVKGQNPRLEVLNAFAYTSGFSVCAALAGMRTTSLDLSKKYLERGQRNFARNGLDTGQHDFIYGDAFDWLKRLAKKGRSFDVVVLDPPTFSQSKDSGVFRAERDFGKLVSLALPLINSGGVLFASTNAADWSQEKFLAGIQQTIRAVGRKISQQHYVPQPPDFPVSRALPAYLKTVWLRVE